MKKTLALIVAAVIIGAISFYGGMKYVDGKDAQANLMGGARGNFQGAAGQQSLMQNGGAGLRNGMSSGGFADGEIIKIDDESMTVRLRDGGSKIAFFSSSTKITQMVEATADDLFSGRTVMVTGTANDDGSITAQSIQIRPQVSAVEVGGAGGAQDPANAEQK